VQQPIRLSDDQMPAVLAASTPLPPDLRGAFLETCAPEIAALPMIGDGILYRVIMRPGIRRTVTRNHHRKDCRSTDSCRARGKTARMMSADLMRVPRL
jgi:hypothetical protein